MIEEKLINDILHFRCHPDETFTECSKMELSKRVVEAENAVKELTEIIDKLENIK